MKHFLKEEVFWYSGPSKQKKLCKFLWEMYLVMLQYLAGGLKKNIAIL